MNRKSKKTGASEELWCYHLDQAYDLPWLSIFRLISFHDCRAASKGSKMQDYRKCSFRRPGTNRINNRIQNNLREMTCYQRIFIALDTIKLFARKKELHYNT